MTQDYSELILSLTTGLTYTLYKKDKYDKILISAMNRFNSLINKNVYVYTLQEFQTLLGMSKPITTMLKKLEKDKDFEIDANSIIFLYSILDTYPNLRKISFEVSENNFERLVNDGTELFSFQMSITDILFDASSFFSKSLVETINKELIKLGKLSNSYLNRSSYVYLKWKDLFLIFANIRAANIDSFDNQYYSYFIDSLTTFLGDGNENDINVLYITDYIQY